MQIIRFYGTDRVLGALNRKENAGSEYQGLAECGNSGGERRIEKIVVEERARL